MSLISKELLSNFVVISNFVPADALALDAWTPANMMIMMFNPMMTSSNGNIFRVTGPLCGEFTGPGEFPAVQWRGALMFSLICAWMNDWVNNREARDLRRHRGHYYVTVMPGPVYTRAGDSTWKRNHGVKGCVKLVGLSQNNTSRSIIKMALSVSSHFDNRKRRQNNTSARACFRVCTCVYWTG